MRRKAENTFRRRAQAYFTEREGRALTQSGLAYALGFASRGDMLGYRGEGAREVMRAALRCETYAEERLYEKDSQKAAEFSLKNAFGWGAQRPDAQEETLTVRLAPGLWEAMGDE